MAKKIQVLVRGRVAELIGEYPYERLRKEWSFTVPGWHHFRHRFGHKDSKGNWIGWDGRKAFLTNHKLPAGLFWATREQVEKDCNVKFKVRVKYPVIETKEGLDSNREYQQECVAQMFLAVRRGGGLVLNATGSGKTRIAVIYASRVNGRVLFVVDQLDLLEQAKKDMENVLGVEVGYVGNSVYEPRRVTVATIQTLFRHRESEDFQAWFESIETIFIDEIHVQMGRRNFDSVFHIQPKVVFGLTATLELKRKEVRTKAYAIAGPVCYEYPIQRGMQEGILATGVGLAIGYVNKIPWDDEQSYQDKYLEYIVRNAERNDIIARLARYGVNKKGRYVLIIVQRIKHLLRLSSRLKDVPHKLVYGAKKVTERIVSKEKFEKGDIRLLIANQVFKKGIDAKRLDTIINAGALKSRNDVIQIFGRGVRTHDEKKGLLFFDITDTDLRPQRGKKGKKIYHRFHVAGKRRKRALKEIGIMIKDFDWDSQGETVGAYKVAGKILDKELGHGKD